MVNIFTVPVDFAASQWLWGICGQCFVEAAADAIEIAAVGGGVSAVQLGRPEK